MPWRKNRFRIILRFRKRGTKLKEDYGQYTDEELLIRFRDGEAAIIEYIMNKYKNLVRSKAKSMYILGADSDDLIQEGMIGLFKAGNSFLIFLKNYCFFYFNSI